MDEVGEAKADLIALDKSMARLLKVYPSDVELPDEVAGPISAKGAGLVRDLISQNWELRRWLEWYKAALSQPLRALGEEDVSSRTRLSRTAQEPPSPDNLNTGKEG